MWGIIIAIASYPAFQKLQHVLRGRGALAAALWTPLLLAILIVPLVLLGQQLVEGLRPLVARLKDGTSWSPEFFWRKLDQPPMSPVLWQFACSVSKVRSTNGSSAPRFTASPSVSWVSHSSKPPSLLQVFSSSDFLGQACGLFIFLFAAILQVGVFVLVPAAVYVFAIATKTKALIFLVWCIVSFRQSCTGGHQESFERALSSATR